MADCSPSTSQQCSEINNLNAKLQYDSAAQTQHQSLVDNQEDSRAWSQLKLKTATDAQNLANRIAQNSATIDHAISAGLVLAGQVGTTEGQQTVSPEGTATSESLKGAVGTAAVGEAVSAEAVAANVANLATALTPVIVSSLAAAISQTIAALVPVVVTAAGGASTPSQTQPKP